MREAARLSGLLRAAAGRPFVPGPRTLPLAAASASINAPGSWEWYVHGAEAPTVLRDSWHALAAEVAKVVGAEASAAVLAELIEKGANKETKAALEKAVGAITASVWTVIEQKASALISARPPPPSSASSAFSKAANAGVASSVQFSYAKLSQTEDDEVMVRALAVSAPPVVSAPAHASPSSSKPAPDLGRPLAWAPNAERDADWLLNSLEVLPIAHTAPINSIANSVLQLLQSTRAELDLQHHLFEMLGGEALDLLPILIKERKRLIQARPALVSSSAARGQHGSGSSAGRHIIGQVVVQSEAEKAAEKQRRKDAQKAAKKNTGIGGDPDSALVLEPETIAAWQAERHAQLTMPTPAPVLAPAGTLKPSSHATLLPEGAKRSERSGYEEVWVPPAKQAELPPNSLVPISAFSELGRTALSAYKTLNRVQSKVFEAAYRTNENLLICAPTGAGKTDIAMMTILHEIEGHWSGGAVRTEEFKIIYVAPMKALATEMVENFTKRLSRLGLLVRELTGDMQLTRKELQETQVIVTTPEKWDVITRKSSDVALTSLVRLLIIDEVHLLHEDRGPVIEAIVARTLRQVEATQSMIRIVGLSATLPNYQDVASFLRVNPQAGLFYFDASYRPVPLEQLYIGVREQNPLKRLALMNQIAFEKCRDRVRNGHQVMIFVHSRKDTVRTAQMLLAMAEESGHPDLFKVKDQAGHHEAWTQVSKSRNQELRELFPAGIAMHHAGMLRADRLLVENLFRRGFIRVICCTATLAWGVNLPAHSVLIKGTQIYEPRAGTFVDLGMLDVMQIFGRAGRPQFDSSGEGIIVTSHDKLAHYLSLMNTQLPVESQFHTHLADHLNAEVALGSVATIADAEQWLRYTFLHVRMRKNPLPYGATVAELEMDPQLHSFTRAVLVAAAKMLDKARMLRFDEAHATLNCTDAGRVASHFYIQHESVETFNEMLTLPMAPELTDARLFALVARATEFEQIRVRDEESKELESLEQEHCPVPVEGDLQPRKVNVLLQAYISQARVEEFALVSDSLYVAQNSARIVRGLFEMVLKKGWSSAALRLLTLAKMLDRRLWSNLHPLRQFPNLRPEITTKLEAKNATIDHMRDLSAAELGALVGNQRLGSVLRDYVRQFPCIEVSAHVQPITRAILKVELVLRPVFVWNEQVHGMSEGWWVWIEDPERGRLYHSEYWTVQRKSKDIDQTISFVVPVQEPLPPQYIVHVVSDRWLGAEHTCAVDFKRLHLPHMPPAHTPLLPLEPLPVSALHNAAWEALYPFSHFNPIQTQAFHTLMYRDCNVLLGAPTGSGKTIAAELAMYRLWNTQPQLKVVYVGPLKALVRERMADWERKFVKGLGKRMVELTGDYTPDVRLLEQADIVTTTPEKWDGISRNWRNRSYVQSVGLLILDEIHLLGEERGPILEVIVSRMRYIAATRDAPVRIVGLSTALANAHDIAAWLGIEAPLGLFNFHSAVRPVPLEVHIQAYAGKHYCLSEEHQVLTELGFMFLDELLRYRQRCPQLRLAAYNHQTKAFSYAAVQDVIVNEAALQTMIEFTAQPEAQRWGEGSDLYGQRGSGCDEDDFSDAEAKQDMFSMLPVRSSSKVRVAARTVPNSNGVSLVVTPDHEMFVRRGRFSGVDHHARWTDVDYAKHKAGDLLGIAVLKTLGRAEQGYVPPGQVPMPPYTAQLGITSTAQDLACLQLFGYWLGDGCLAVQAPCEGVVLSVAKQHDIAFLRECFAVLDLKPTETAAMGEHKVVQFKFRGPWYDFLFAEYGHKYGHGLRTSWAGDGAALPFSGATALQPERPYDFVSSEAGSFLQDEEVKSAKWIPYWAWQLRKEQLRALLSGLQRADGEEAAGVNAIYTSSIRFRDELVRLCIHAGYAPHFRCKYRAGAIRRVAPQGKQIIANQDSWKVLYRDDPHWANPVLDGERGDIKEVQYMGRTWCVTVPTGLIIVRRAARNEAGHVTKASLVQIIGNCPRMATMNKPAFQAIRSYSQGKPALVFVSSRRQTRLTAVDLIACALASDEPHQFLHMSQAELDRVIERVRDASLKHTLQFGIGLHHAGVVEADRRLCEELFAAEKIGVLVSTATLAWGVNLPAHLVIIKGTEFYDAKTRRYVDMPITDVLQMMGRAGRPQFDTRGVAVVMVHEPKKDFYHRFLYEPFPVESSLDKQLHDHLLAETVSGTIASRQDAVDYLTWTYYFRRLVRNPSYYGLEDNSAEGLNAFLSGRLDAVLTALSDAQCVEVDDENGTVEATPLGRIASFYYLHYNTVQHFNTRLTQDAAEAEVLQALCDAPEYAELPVRHNEEELNAELAKDAKIAVEARLLDSPHVKALLLLQAHMSRSSLPVTDYVSDTRSVLEQSTRVLQAMIDVAAHAGRLKPALAAMRVLQSLHQARWWSEFRTSPSLLPHWDAAFAAPLSAAGFATLSALLGADSRRVRDALGGLRSAEAFVEALSHVPRLQVSVGALSPVAQGADVTIQIQVTRNGKRGIVPTPMFPKRLDHEQYWAVLGSEHGELFALKRVQFSAARTTISLSFDAPTRPGKHDLHLHLLCDAFAGIDQDVSVALTVE